MARTRLAAWYRWFADLHEDEVLISWWAARIQGFAAWATPARRRAILGTVGVPAAVAYPLATVAYWAPSIPRGATLVAAALLFGFALACHRAAHNLARLPAWLRWRPQAALHACFWVVLVAVWLVPAGSTHAVLAASAVAFPMLLWRLAYLVRSGTRGSIRGTRLRDHLVYLFPAWGGSNIPYGKGFEFLTRQEAGDATALARSQLAGVKLFCLALLWRVLRGVLGTVLYGGSDPRMPWASGGAGLGIARLPDVLGSPAGPPLLAAWAAMYAQLVMDLLRLAIEGHLYVGGLRLLGFHVFRNTYKPLLAESVLEFWNRYHFYFKELMVEMFFYPTFLRRFRRWPRGRIVAAVFAAAGLGNAYYHLVKIAHLLVQGELAAVRTVMLPRVVYCGLLATAISVSMLRERARRGTAESSGPARRAVRIALTVTFIAVIRVFLQPGDAGVGERAWFLLGLLGVGR